MVDGQLLGEGEYKREEDWWRPANLNLELASVKVANLNVFNSSLSVERMIGLTTAGEGECGSPGDLVSWEEAEWTLHSQAKLIEVDREWEGPCRRESQVQVFTADFKKHTDCMWHCQKISKGQGRAPPVITEEEWKKFLPLPTAYILIMYHYTPTTTTSTSSSTHIITIHRSSLACITMDHHGSACIIINVHGPP